MKIFTIVIHVLPTELSELHRLLSDLKKSIHMLNNSMDTSNLKFNIFVTLNISDKLMEFTDKSVFLSYYHELYQEFNNYLSLNFNTSDDLNIAGTTAQKRYVIHTDDESDVFIFLDPDIYFPSDLLYYMVISENIASNDTDMFVITPNTVKLWDDTWDCLVNNRYKNEEYGFHKTINPTEAYAQEIDSVNLSENTTFKFGCGWFTMYSKKFVKDIGIPESFGDYGSEDTYMMECAKMMRSHGINVKQYVIDGVFIVEDYIIRPKFNETLVKYNQNKSGAKTHNSPVFAEELNIFFNKLNRNM